MHLNSYYESDNKLFKIPTKQNINTTVYQLHARFGIKQALNKFTALENQQTQTQAEQEFHDNIW